MKDIGRRLKSKREALGLSVEEVQAETKIRRRYIEALEAGEEGPIPGEVYVKGFLRFYGNFLGLDGPELVRDYTEWKLTGGEGAVVAPTPTQSRAPAGSAARAATQAPSGSSGATHSSRGARKTPRPLVGVGRLAAYVLLIVALVAAGGIWYIWNHYDPVAAPGEGVGPGEDGEPAPPGADQPDPGNDPPVGSDPDHELAWNVSGASAELLSYVVYGAPFTVGLEVTTDRCWVKVVVDGQVVLERTLPPGTTGEWSARSEMSIVLGRPQLVELRLDGNELGRAGTVDAPRTVRFRVETPPGGSSGSGLTPGDGGAGGA